MKKVPNEEDPRTLRRLPAAVTGEGNEGEEGDVAVDEATIRLMEMLKGQIKLPLTKRRRGEMLLPMDTSLACVLMLTSC